jgi:hypothetical protein
MRIVDAAGKKEDVIIGRDRALVGAGLQYRGTSNGGDKGTVYVQGDRKLSGEELQRFLNGGDQDFGIDRQSNAYEMLTWMFENMEKKELRPDDAPSPGAWSYLLRVRQDEALKDEFYKNIWPKTFPSKKMMESMADAMTDDGRRQLKRLDDLLNLVGE